MTEASPTVGSEPTAVTTAAPAPVAAAAPPAFSEAAPAIESSPAPVEAIKAPEAVKTEAPKTEAKKEGSFLGDLLNKDEAKEAAPDAPKPEPPVAGDLPSFQDWTFPETVRADDALIKDFNGILGEIARDNGLTQEQAQAFGQRLVDFYVKDQMQALERASNAQRDSWEKYQETKRNEFRTDDEVGRNRIDTTTKRVGAVLDRYASAMGAERAKALRERLVASGMDNDVEMIKFINWNARFMVETAKPVAAHVPKAPQTTSRSARRYAGTTGAA